MPNAAAAIDGSVKYLVSDVRIAALDRKLGFQDGISSITNIICNAFRYETMVFSSKVLSVPATMSVRIFDNGTCPP